MKITKIDERTVTFDKLEEGDLFKTDTTDSIFRKGTDGNATRIFDENGVTYGVCSFNSNFKIIPIELVELKYKEV